MNDFMKDRYGVDDLTTALGGAGMVVALIGSLVRVSWIQWVAIAVVIVAVLRALSKNIPARQKENDAFQGLVARFKGGAGTGSAAAGPKQAGRARSGAQAAALSDLKRQARTAKTMWRDRKTKAFLKCPSCGTTLAVPKGKGKLIVTCPKCHAKMETRS